MDLLTTMEEQHQELNVSLPDDLVAFVDPAKIQQMVYNLLENAIKYTPSGGKIRIRLTRSGTNGVLEITDSGVGIPQTDLSRIYDRFYRVDKARSRSTGGTGLGLSIVKQVILLHDGEITVRSEEGKGTTFRVSLPLL